MTKLPNALRTWNTDAFARTLKGEIEDLCTNTLPLDQGTSQGGNVDDSDIEVMVLNAVDANIVVQAKIGVLFTEIVASYCGCPIETIELNAYCEMHVSINKATAEAEFLVTPD